MRYLCTPRMGHGSLKQYASGVMRNTIQRTCQSTSPVRSLSLWNVGIEVSKGSPPGTPPVRKKRFSSRLCNSQGVRDKRDFLARVCARTTVFSGNGFANAGKSLVYQGPGGKSTHICKHNTRLVFALMKSREKHQK